MKKNLNKRTLNVSLIGATGRMGLANAQMISCQKNMNLAGAVVEKTNRHLGTPLNKLCDCKSSLVLEGSLQNILNKTNVFVDFSTPSSTLAHLKEVSQHKKAYLIGTTGFSKKEEKIILKYSKKIPILKSGNFSLGINMLLSLSEQVARKLNEWDLEITERHHNQKVDAPSGTAKMILETCCEAKNWSSEKIATPGRHGVVGTRKQKEIGVFALRGGGVVGEHSLFASSNHEELVLKHTAFNRAAFSSGVILGTLWISKQKPGLYKMTDVLK